MITTTFPRPPSDLIDPPAPPPPDVIARRWIERRTGVSPALAEAYRCILGLGAHREGAHR